MAYPGILQQDHVHLNYCYRDGATYLRQDQKLKSVIADRTQEPK